MITVTLYYRDHDEATGRVRSALDALQADYPHQVVLIDIASEAALASIYSDRIPVVQIGPYKLEGDISQERLQIALGAARDRQNQLEKVDQDAYRNLVKKGKTVNSGDRLSYWISKNYIHVFNVLMAIYVGLPFLAPVLARNGAELPANLIYKVYGVLCHQLAYRSWFLYGEQAFYPRELAGVPGVETYEEMSGKTAEEIFDARAFIGNEQVGYKVALCERDVAMYLAMLGFGIVFWLSGRRIRSIPWYVWVVVGLGPIGVDGLSQLPSVIANLPAWLPIRESTPFLRTLTGGLFGLMTAWYLYPMIEDTMGETRRLVARKIATAAQLIEKE